MKVLITGAGGLVGGALAGKLESSATVVAARRSDLDISKKADVEHFVQSCRPDLIINCAVIGVDECEADPDKAQKINVDGPANLARSATKVGAAIVHLSTNYVFDGERDQGTYTIDDQPRPINVYGRTKYEGEQAVRAECRRSYIVRTSWVYGGSKPTFFNNAISALRRGVPVEAIEDNWASTTYVADLVERVSEIDSRRHYGIFHVVNEGICSKYEFAVEAARIIGMAAKDIEKLVIPVRASAIDSNAIRPRYSPMSCRLSAEMGMPPMRRWTDALSSFINIPM